ncbi:hypothetical protein B0G57_10250 [Trinickia symbiotica]|nr:hypothetical protein B0G57_10250 [Trinickia symbiotica]
MSDRLELALAAHGGLDRWGRGDAGKQPRNHLNGE